MNTSMTKANGIYTTEKFILVKLFILVFILSLIYTSSTYRTKKFFRTEDAYANVNDYNKENGTEAIKYYPATSSYELVFKKAGTYKISYTDYTYDDLYILGSDADDNDVIKKYNIQTGSYDIVTKCVWIPSIYNTNTTYVSNGVTYDRTVEGYYAGENGQKFDYYNELNLIEIKMGADGKNHNYYTPSKRITYTKEEVIKVVDSKNILKSVKLGKSTYKNYTVGKEGGATISVKRGKFLTGKDGKVTVKMGTDYKLNSIVAVTYDAENNREYNLVKNNGKVTYGVNKNAYKSEEGATYKYFYESMYKPTMIYVYYDNKTDGYGTTVKSQGTDAEGNQTYVIEDKSIYKDSETNKKYTLVDTYNVTRKKSSPTSTSYRYYYTKTDQYFDSTTKTVKSETYDSSSSSLPGENYTSVTFYSK